MNQKRLHTPDGVRDLIDRECADKLTLENRLQEVFHRYGCRDIETPTIEYLDVFGQDIGTTPARELYRFFDREGETLVLRPDFTPAIARAAARYYLENPDPIRLCYRGNTFIQHENLRGLLGENTQMGAELLQDPSADADAEAIAMALDTLLAAGLKDIQLSLGSAAFFKALTERAALDASDLEKLISLLRNRNTFGVEKMLEPLPLSEDLKNLFVRLGSLYGGEEILDEALSICRTEKIEEAVSRLREVFSILRLYGLHQYVSVDLGMISSFRYYTGIIFRGYTYGTGEAIVKGGRYDHLLSVFGKEAPAVGFVVVIGQLMNALQRQSIPVPSQPGYTLIVYRKERREDAVAAARDLRSQGKRVQTRLISSGEAIPAEETCGSDYGYTEIIRFP